ncbi:MAG TPA: helicase C-terminal domain-containing protein [Pyrinomonadaceae bacterium]
MSTELQQTDVMDAEIVSPEMIEDAVANCFVTLGDAPERALELVTPEEIAAIEDADDDLDSEAAQEVETAEEISLKNGVYHEIRRKLNERFQIPLEQIAFIHEADTPARKAALFKAVNSGRVRVLIGSTSKLGTGVNVQRRLVALHHVDEPWKPAELEQREGRILRQGNIYPEAFIFHYVTERSFDGYMLQTLESKARFISQIMAGEVTARTAEDVGDMVLTVAQVKAIASGNPMVQKRIELEVKLVKLDRLRAAYYNNRAAMRADLEELPDRIAAQKAELRGHEEAIKARQPLKEDSFLIILKKNLGDVESTTFDKRERAGAHLRYLADLLIDRLRRGSGGMSLTEEVGSYRGFKVFVHASGNSRFAHHSTLFGYNAEVRLCAVEGGTIYVAQIGESNVGITQSIDYQLRHLEDRLEQARAGLEMLNARLQTVKAEVDKPWAYAAEYRRLRRHYEEMGAALQSEGIEVESNTMFTAEDGEGDDDLCEASASAEEQTSATTTDDELSARHNPFTGLEEFPIIVEEPETEGDEFDELRQAEADMFSSAMFDFEGRENGQADELNNADIFSDAVPDTEREAHQTSPEHFDGSCSVSSEDLAVPTDGDKDGSTWSIAESADEVRPTKHQTFAVSARPRAERKTNRPKDSAQIGFSW